MKKLKTEPIFDILIKNGTIVDGSGTDSYVSDIGIKGEKIVDIGHFYNLHASKMIYADGLIVCPGFIDIHSHTDQQLLLDSPPQNKIRQGVTTEIGGNCGNSAFPWTKKNFFAQEGDSFEWISFNDFADSLERKGLVVNYCSLVGYGSLYDYSAKIENSTSSQSMFARIKKVLLQCMEEGALGLSTGLAYPPSSFAPEDEINELCKLVQKYGGIYAAHIRDEGYRIIDSIKEIIQTSEETEISAQISHLKIWGRKNWDKIEEVLSLLHSANSRGIQITADRYPFLAGGTFLDYVLPSSVKDRGEEHILRSLIDRKILKQIQQEIVEEYEDWDTIGLPAKIAAELLLLEQNNHENLLTVDQISKRLKMSQFETIIELLKISMEKNIKIYAYFFMMCEENLEKIIECPYVMIGSDGDPFVGEMHPRYWGTFPKIIEEYVRKRHVLNLPEAIKKMTHFPAKKMGLKRRGLIKKGYYADIVVFNFNEISNQAKYGKIGEFPIGIHNVLVNGSVVIRNGMYTGTLVGKVLRNE